MHRLLAIAVDTLRSLREHPLRALLSILGLVIGVAALVAILALADGMEAFARDQIGSTTDLQNITVTARAYEQIDGVAVRRRNVSSLTLQQASSLAREIAGDAVISLIQQRTIAITSDSIRTAATLFAADADIWSLRSVQLQDGRVFTAEDVTAEAPVVVISAALAARLEAAGPVLGREILVGEQRAEIVGILSGEEMRPAEAYGPFAVFAIEPNQASVNLYARALHAEEVELTAGKIRDWLNQHVDGGSAGYTISTNEMRVRQVRQGMLLMRLVFGLITGISVLVGGVGVMNVLLITVTERTREIGIRKAVGATRRDIKVQFLGEAMAIAVAGSLIGLLVGLAAVFALVPIIRQFTEVTLHAAVTGETLVVVGTVAVGVGLLFGTYPAARAARLSPVEAMRHE